MNCSTWICTTLLGGLLVTGLTLAPGCAKTFEEEVVTSSHDLEADRYHQRQVDSENWLFGFYMDKPVYAQGDTPFMLFSAAHKDGVHAMGHNPQAKITFVIESHIPKVTTIEIGDSKEVPAETYRLRGMMDLTNDSGGAYSAILDDAFTIGSPKPVPGKEGLISPLPLKGNYLMTIHIEMQDGTKVQLEPVPLTVE